ncbi:hypothetical protein ACJD0Z_14350 [Flavobacteriaceae bacterium M23B6Z8]
MKTKTLSLGKISKLSFKKEQIATFETTKKVVGGTANNRSIGPACTFGGCSSC